MALRPVSIAAVYDGGSRGNPAPAGHTAQVVANAIVEGALGVPGTEVTLVRLGGQELPWDVLDRADTILLGCPTYMGSASAALRAFMEESLRPQLAEHSWQDKLAAGFTDSAGTSGDKLATLQQLSDFAAQHGMVWISFGTPPESDLTTARRFGERVARLTQQWARGREASDAVAIVLDAFDAVERGDDERQVELYHPQATFHWPPSLPYGGTARAGNRRSTWEESWRPFQPSPAERQLSPRVVAASEDEVVVLWHQRGRSEDGEQFDGEVLGLYSVRDGKFARAQMFYFDSAGAARFLERALDT